MSTPSRKINPDSAILSQAVVAGAGMFLPPNVLTPPPGMGAVVLFIPLACMQDKSPIEMQADMGLPWCGPNGAPYWFPQNQPPE